MPSEILEKILDYLPPPIFLAVAALVVAIFLIQALGRHRSWTTVIRGREFLAVFAAIVISLAGFYAWEATRWIWPAAAFSEQERGIAILRLVNDEDERAQVHISDFLGIQLTKRREYRDVVIKRLELIADDRTEHERICGQMKATICISGSFTDPSVNLWFLSMKDTTIRPGATIEDFRKADKAVEIVQGMVDAVAPTSDDPRVRIAFLEQQVRELERRLEAQQSRPDLTTIIRPIETTGSPDKHRSLLAIGVSEYSEYPPLELSVSDTRAVATLFESQGATVSIQLNADRAETWDAMKTFDEQLQEEEQAWVYLTGHTVIEADEAFFVPVDGSARNLRASAISLNDIRKWFLSLKAKQAILVIDACYSGRIAPQAMGAVQPSYEELLNAEGKIIIASSSGSEQSFTEYSAGGGLFTKALLNGMSGKADLSNDGIITGDELSYFVRNEVQSIAASIGVQQNPSTSVVGRDFIVARVASPAADDFRQGGASR
jgi:hypothetical protein